MAEVGQLVYPRQVKIQPFQVVVTNCLIIGKGLNAPYRPHGLNRRDQARRILLVLFGKAACSVNGKWMVADPTERGQATA